MGSSKQKITEQTSNVSKNRNLIKMVFYIYEQPAFLEHFHPRIYQPVRSVSRHWDLLENLFDQEEMACQSSQNHCSSRSEKKSLEKSTNSTTDEGKMDVEIKNNEENTTVEP